MKFRKGNWKIDSRSLIDVEWRKSIPRLIVHEKYEKIIKWTLRILTFIGIATSVISLEWYYSLLLAIVLLVVEQFIERAIFEYTTMIVQKMPDFEVDGKRWKTMGFAFPPQKDNNYPPYMGPAFDTEEYARNFFNYIKSWNDTNDEDPYNNIIVSFVMEPNSTYTVSIYANPARKNLDAQFKTVAEQRKFEKYGKRHQQLIMQVKFANNFEYKPGLLIHEFLTTYSDSDTYYFTPFVTNPQTNELKILNSLSIKKFQFKHKRRENLTLQDHEYHTKIDYGY